MYTQSIFFVRNVQMKKVIKLFVFTLLAMQFIPASHCSDDDDDIALSLSNQLRGSIKYKVNEPRGQLKPSTFNEFLEHVGIVDPKCVDDLKGAKFLSLSIDRVAGLYLENIHQQTVLSDVFRSSTMALQNFSLLLTFLCGYLHNNPPILNTCFRLTLNSRAIA